MEGYHFGCENVQCKEQVIHNSFPVFKVGTCCICKETSSGKLYMTEWKTHLFCMRCVDGIFSRMVKELEKEKEKEQKPPQKKVQDPIQKPLVGQKTVEYRAGGTKIVLWRCEVCKSDLDGPEACCLTCELNRPTEKKPPRERGKKHT
jgi:hypothetical protein